MKVLLRPITKGEAVVAIAPFGFLPSGEVPTAQLILREEEVLFARL